MRIHVCLLCAFAAMSVFMVPCKAFTTDRELSAFYIHNVCFVRQSGTYWCGPASLTMCLNYWGANISQEIVAAEVYNPSTNLTSKLAMREYPEELGFKTEELTGSMNGLRRRIGRGFPVVVLQKYSLQDAYGHYRVVVGYNDETQQVTTFDPILGPNYNISYTEFTELWKPGSTFSVANWTLVVLPKWLKMEEYLLLFNQEGYEQFIGLESIYLIVSAIALGFGAVGGIPQIMRWMSRKPRLKIVESKIEGLQESRIRIHLEVKNEKKWWGRNSDATYVTAEWLMVDKTHEQWGSVRNQVLSPYLPIGVKISQQFSSSHSFKSEGNPHTIFIFVKCREGIVRRKKITYIYEGD